LIEYQLSQRQLKELTNRKTLQIAIPDPGDLESVEARLAYVRAALPGVAKTWIESIRPESIEVQASDAGDGEVMREIGVIVRDSHQSAERLRWWVEVLVVRLCATDSPRGTYPVQWPGGYRVV
jgi:hypothetical protein